MYKHEIIEPEKPSLTQETIETMEERGWELVSVDNGRLYFRREFWAGEPPYKGKLTYQWDFENQNR